MIFLLYRHPIFKVTSQAFSPLKFTQSNLQNPWTAQNFLKSRLVSAWHANPRENEGQPLERSCHSDIPRTQKIQVFPVGTKWEQRERVLFIQALTITTGERWAQMREYFLDGAVLLFLWGVSTEILRQSKHAHTRHNDMSQQSHRLK